MKKLFIILTTLMICGIANAQNSKAESTFEEETKAEKFLSDASLYREDTYIKLKEDGITAYVRVATNLISNQKIGYCYFETEVDRTAKFFSGGKDGDPEPLGYLDREEIDDMILALNKIVEDTKVKKDVKYYEINYTTSSGINVHYDTKSRQVFYIKWFTYINEYGVTKTYALQSPPATLKSLTKTIAMLEKAVTIIDQNTK